MRRTLCLIAAVASLAVTSTAFAQSAPAPNPEAVKHFLAGKNLRDEGKCDLAIKELEASVKIEESIGGRYNLGVCYEKTNKRLAYVNYERALTLAKEKQDDREREIAAQRYAFLKANPPVRLAMPQPLPPDTKVTVDGDPVPTEDLQGETIYFPKAEREQYDVRVTAPGYDDVRVSIDKSATQKNSLFTVTMKKHQDATAPVAPQPRATETKWGPFQFLGLGLIVVGAAGITYSSVEFVSYSSDESNLHDKFNAAEKTAAGCPSNSPPESTCGKNITTREDLRKEYNANEDYAKSHRPVWLTLGIGGILAVAGGVALIVWGPKSEVESGTAKATKPTFRLVPALGTREQGLSVVGTF